MFSQRHYVAIADLLKETGFDNPHLVEAFCKLFAKDNDRFKPERFKDAVGFDEEELEVRLRMDAPKLYRIKDEVRPFSAEMKREFNLSTKIGPPEAL